MVSVKSKKRQRLAITGSNATGQFRLKGVAPQQRKVDLFVGRLDPETTDSDVSAHVDFILGEAGKVEVKEITHCLSSYGYRGFVVSVPLEHRDAVLSGDKWPSYVSLKRYFPPKHTQGNHHRSGKMPVLREIAKQRPLTRSRSTGDVAVARV